MLYHYTSPEAIMGILREEGICLRFSRYDCLNDINEGKRVISVQDDACRDLEAEFGSDEKKLKILQSIRGLRPDFRSASIASRGVSTVPYICSFSGERDALTMWNYYTKGRHYEGYNIGLEPDGEKMQLYDAKCGSKCDRFHFEEQTVIYDRKQQYDIVSEAVRRAAECENFNKSEYIAQMNNWAIAFKDDIFRHEKESRLICYVPEGGAPRERRKIDELIRFRQVNGCLIPYIDILIENKAALREVTIGPLIEKRLASETMKLFLRLRGYGDVKINTSFAPIRY